MADEQKPRTIKMYATWTLIEAGKYKPVTLVPEWAKGESVRVAIDVPFTPEFIDNYEEVLQGEIAGNFVKAVLTATGFAYALDQYQGALDPESKKVEKDQIDENGLTYID